MLSKHGSIASMSLIFSYIDGSGSLHLSDLLQLARDHGDPGTKTVAVAVPANSPKHDPMVVISRGLSDILEIGNLIASDETKIEEAQRKHGS